MREKIQLKKLYCQAYHFTDLALQMEKYIREVVKKDVGNHNAYK